MPRRKQSMAQTELPVGNTLGTPHDPDEAFEREYGEEVAARERIAYREARRCTCGSPNPHKWGTKWGHSQGCPRAGRRF